MKEALQRLYESGHVAYVVGGCVRDFLLGKESKDYDIATDADPDEICQLFPHSITVGKAFGVIKVPTESDPPLLEIATFRQDMGYEDHRHPRRVAFSDAYQDAMRRDFTINALFYDPKTLKILDACGGIEDLENKVIRAIGNPHERFGEDALRLLRAVRFQTRFGFSLHPDTAQAIRDKARLITKVSAERIRDELTLMWTGQQPAQALAALSELGLLSLILPEVEALKGMAQIPSIYHDRESDVWAHLLKTLEILVQKKSVRNSTLSWAAVLHEVGKPIASLLNSGKNFNGHEIEGAKLAKEICQRLKMARSECDRIAAMLGDHLKFREVFQMRESTLQRFIRHEYFEDLLSFHEADAAASDGNLAYSEFCFSRLEALKKEPSNGIVKLVDGKDLIQLGFQPGPEFSEILNVIEDLSLEKKLHSKEEALEYVIRNFVK